MRSGHTLAVLASLSSLALCASVQASTITLTGGDTADGLQLSGTLFGAIYLDKAATGSPITLQGYAFQP